MRRLVTWAFLALVGIVVWNQISSGLNKAKLFEHDQSFEPDHRSSRVYHKRLLLQRPEGSMKQIQQ